MKFTTLAAALFSTLVAVSAAPIQEFTRDVFVPKILSPVADDVWTVGSVQTVTWDVSDAPAQITNGKGQVILGKSNRIFSTQEGGFEDPLAADFDILAGSVNVTVPVVDDVDDYFIVLFGDSGNWSGNFTITSTPPTTEA